MENPGHHLRYGIFGAGAIGHAIGDQLQKAGRQLSFWDQEANKRTVSSIGAFIQHSDVIVLCVPSWVHPAALESLAELVSDDHIIISVAKGVGQNFARIDQMLAEHFADRLTFGLLDGPMLAAEVATRKNGYGILSLSRVDAEPVLQRDLSLAGIFVEINQDMPSVAMCAVLKNIYAIGFGIHDGLGRGSNSKGALAVKTLAEAKTVMHKLQFDPTLMEGYAGLGDLLATGWSESSYNYRIGKALAAKISGDGASGEGVNALRQLHHVLNVDDFELLQMLDHIINQGAPAELLNEICEKK